MIFSECMIILRKEEIVMNPSSPKTLLWEMRALHT